MAKAMSVTLPPRDPLRKPLTQVGAAVIPQYQELAAVSYCCVVYGGCAGWQQEAGENIAHTLPYCAHPS